MINQKSIQMKAREMAPLLFIFIAVAGCSKNAIEGDVFFIGGNQPASGVTVEALTKTDIKEEMNRARKVVKTDPNGHFRITGLLKNSNYEIRVIGPPCNDNRVDAFGEVLGYGSQVPQTRYVNAPEKGTFVITEAIRICPVPPATGVWIYEDPAKSPIEIKFTQDNKVTFRVRYVLNGDRYVFFSLSNEEAKQVSAKIPRKGLLVFMGTPEGVKDIGKLNHIQSKVIQFEKAVYEVVNGQYVLNYKPGNVIHIEEGWYYNIKDFYKEHMSQDYYIVGASVSEPNFRGAVNSSSCPLLGIPLEDLDSGLYMLMTKAYDGQAPGSVAVRSFGKAKPLEGYIIQVGE